MSKLLPFVVLVLAGCGGGHHDEPCVGPLGNEPDPAYTGSYVGTFVADGGGGRLDLALVVAADGSVRGTVHDPSVTPQANAPVTGFIDLVEEACDSSDTGIKLDFALPGGPPDGIYDQ